MTMLWSSGISWISLVEPTHSRNILLCLLSHQTTSTSHLKMLSVYTTKSRHVRIKPQARHVPRCCRCTPLNLDTFAAVYRLSSSELTWTYVTVSSLLWRVIERWTVIVSVASWRWRYHHEVCWSVSVMSCALYSLTYQFSDNNCFVPRISCTFSMLDGSRPFSLSLWATPKQFKMPKYISHCATWCQLVLSTNRKSHVGLGLIPWMILNSLLVMAISSPPDSQSINKFILRHGTGMSEGLNKRCFTVVGFTVVRLWGAVKTCTLEVRSCVKPENLPIFHLICTGSKSVKCGSIFNTTHLWAAHIFK